MTYPETLPGTPVIAGDEDHIIDHETIRTALANIDTRLNTATITNASQDSAISGKAASGHAHSGVYDPAGSASTAQAAAVQRANHTGVQLASTISNFDTQVRTNRLDQMATPTAAVALGSQKITGLATPTAGTDAATKAYADSLTSGGLTIQEEGTSLTVRSTLNFVGSGVTATDNGTKTVVTIPGGSGTPELTRYRNALDEGVVCDGRVIIGSIASGTTTYSVGGSLHPDLGAAVFSASDVGKAIHIPLDNGTWHKTTVFSFTNAQVVLVSHTAPSASTSKKAIVGTDNGPAINVMFASAVPGDVLYFPGFSQYYFSPTGNHALNALHVTVAGDGPLMTQFISTHITNNFFTSTNTSTPFVVGQVWRDFNVFYGGYFGAGSDTSSIPYPTAGAGMRQTGAGWVNNYYYRVIVTGFHIGFDAREGTRTRFEECDASGCRSVGFWLDTPTYPDMGDQHLFRCTVGGWEWYAITTYGVLWNSGGNVSIIGCNFGSIDYMIYFNYTSGGFGTGNIRISDCSFEDFNNRAITISVPQGLFSLGSICITGNTIQSVTTTGHGIDISSVPGTNRTRTGTYHGVHGIAVTGNTMNNSTGQYLCVMNWVYGGSVLGNGLLDYTKELSQTNCVGIKTVT